MAMFDHLPVTRGDQFLAHFVRQSPNLTFADVDLRHLDRISGIAKRGKSRGGGDDLFDNGGTVGVLIEAQRHPLTAKAA